MIYKKQSTMQNYTFKNANLNPFQNNNCCNRANCDFCDFPAYHKNSCNCKPPKQNCDLNNCCFNNCFDFTTPCDCNFSNCKPYKNDDSCCTQPNNNYCQNHQCCSPCQPFPQTFCCINFGLVDWVNNICNAFPQPQSQNNNCNNCNNFPCYDFCQPNFEYNSAIFKNCPSDFSNTNCSSQKTCTHYPTFWWGINFRGTKQYNKKL